MPACPAGDGNVSAISRDNQSPLFLTFLLNTYCDKAQDVVEVKIDRATLLLQGGVHMNDVISNLGFIFTVIASLSGGLVAAGLTNKKERRRVLDKLQSMKFFHDVPREAALIWMNTFEYFFGGRILSKRQFLTIPIYTFLTSGIFLLFWLAYFWGYQSIFSLSDSYLPPHIVQGVSDFYSKGIYSILIIDFIAIILTKYCIKKGRVYGFSSLRFYVSFIFTLLFVLFLFSVSMFVFKVADTVDLYTQVAPNDPLPLVPFHPIQDMVQASNLFEQRTVIHFTSVGAYSTYFMPEPVIFYCTIVAQLSLFFIFLSCQISMLLLKLKKACVNYVRLYGTADGAAFGVIGLVWSNILLLPLLVLSIFYVLSKLFN